MDPAVPLLSNYAKKAVIKVEQQWEGWNLQDRAAVIKELCRKPQQLNIEAARKRTVKHISRSKNY